MPGITGLLTKRATGNEDEIVACMRDAMRYEPFYTSTTYTHPELGVYVGAVSIAGSFSDCMPVWNDDHSIALFLTGEVFAEASDVRALHSRTRNLSPADARFLVYRYEQSPQRFLAELNGWCNGLIVDLRQHTAVLFNDRCGIRRVYIHEGPDALYFGSEAKSLLAVLPQSRQADPQSIGEFMCYDCVLEGRTYFKDIHLMPPASAWTFQARRLRKASYFKPSSLEEQDPLPPGDFLESLGATFEQVLPRYFHGGRVGMSLTGGLDTRMIMAAHAAPPGELPCFTFGGSYRDILDVRLAARVAAACHQPHTVLRLDDDRFLEDYAEHLYRSTYYTDGLERPDTAEVIHLNRRAREISIRRMTGKYGSQVLKHLAGFKARIPTATMLDGHFVDSIAGARETCAGILREHPLTFMLTCEIPWWWNRFVAAESSQLEVRSPYLDNDIVKLVYRSPFGAGADWGATFQWDFIGRHAPQLTAIPTNKGLQAGRNPLLRPTRWMFTFLNAADKLYIRERLPASLTHHVARLDAIFKPLRVDRLVTGYADFRRYRVWFRDQIADFLRETLLSPQALSRPYWSADGLRRVVEGHVRGQGNYLLEIRKALQIEMIHRVLLEAAWRPKSFT